MTATDGTQSSATRLEGDGSVDKVKRTYRDVKTDVKKTARDVDGTDLKDRVGNAADETRKDLGNLGDDVRKAGREPEDRRSDGGHDARAADVKPRRGELNARTTAEWPY